MPRARLLKPGFFSNEDLLDLPFEGRLLFAGLWTLADKAGRLEDRPKRIKIELFPADNVDVDELLEALARKGFLQRYEVAGLRLIQVSNFEKHQHPHHKEPESTLPPPNETLFSPRLALDQPRAGTGKVSADPSEAVTKSSNGSIAEAEAVSGNHALDAPPHHAFAFVYAQKFNDREHKPLDSRTHSAALTLEARFGADRCIRMAEIDGWDKHPNYYVKPLEEGKDGDRGGKGSGKPGETADPGGVAGGLSDMDRRRAAIDERRRRSEERDAAVRPVGT